MITQTITIGLLCIVCFIVGAKVGQKVTKGETIAPIKTPTKIIEEFKDNRQQRRETERNKIIAENIDNYDGTGLNQKTLPR